MSTLNVHLRSSARLFINNYRQSKIFWPPTYKPQSVGIRNMSSSPTYTAQYLIEKLQKELEAEHVDVEDLSNCGCGMKFDAVLVSQKFDGKPVLQRQRLVNKILVEELKHIHAFTMRTLTPEQWKGTLSEKQKS